MPGWKALPEELDPDLRAFTERLRRLIDRSGLGVTAVAERTGRERSVWDTYLNARQSVPRSAVVALAEVTGSDPAALATDWERAERAWARTAAPVEAEGGEREPEDGDGGYGRGPGGDDRTMEIRRLDRPHPAAPLPASGAPASGTPAPGTPAPGTPASGAPAPAPAAVPPARNPVPPSDAPPARTPDSRRRKVLLSAAGVIGALLVVTAALLLVDLGGSEGPGEGDKAAAPPTTTAPPTTRRASLPPGVRCAGSECTGQDPEAMGCGGPLATTVARAVVGAAQVEVRYSATCGAAWARLTGGAPRDTVTIRAGDAERRATVAAGTDTVAKETDAYTPMVAVASATAARACGQLADGSEGCTTSP
ncbi:DUF2690 domain-containing protein [Streptomyces sp. NPDC001930]|uniref:helix-turn-helix domain-containing protein n=1 Tax=Streptomyces sp. NPDC001930 TaxID=3364625 RepID=UPI00367EAB9F